MLLAGAASAAIQKLMSLKTSQMRQRYLHEQALDTSTPSGRAMFQMCGVFAEFELAMIKSRINAGLARAKAQGRKLGRPSGLTGKKETEARALLARGVGVLKIGKQLGVGTGTIQKIKREMHPTT